MEWSRAALRPTLDEEQLEAVAGFTAECVEPPAFLGIEPLVHRVGKFVMLNDHHLDKTTNFFTRYGGFTVFVSRFIPVVRHIISIPAGLAEPAGGGKPLPVGFQICGPAFSEGALLDAAHAIEQAIGFDQSGGIVGAHT